MAETTVDRGARVVPPLPPVGKYPKGFDPRKAPADRGGVSILDFLGKTADFIEPAFTTPLGDAPVAQVQELARELTGVPAYFRVRRADIEGRPRDDADVYSLVPGLGAVGGFTRKAKKVAGVALDAKQLAARIGATQSETVAPKIGAVTDAQKAFSEHLKNEVATRKPGFLQTAEERIGRGTSTVAKATEDDAGKLLGEAEGDFLAQRRGVRTHEQTQEAVQNILRSGLRAEDVVQMGKVGTAVNAEHLVAANKIADDVADSFVKAVDSGGDAVAALLDALKVQRAVRGFITEGARVTEANKLIKTEIAERAAKDTSAPRQLIQAVRGLDNPDNLRAVVSLAKGINFGNKDEVRRFLQVVTEMGEMEARAKIPAPTLGENIVSAVNLPKTIMASYDLSAPFRQGAVLSVGHPGVAANASKAMVASLKDAGFARQAMAEIQSAPLAPLRKKAGLYLSEWENTPLKAREEAFMSNFASKIPGISASNRAYAVYLNKLRADVFDKAVEAWGGPLAKKESEYRALASFINYATGRGDLGPFNTSAPLLNALFFSPRLVVSRAQTIAAPLLFAAQGNPAAAKMAAGELVKFVGAGMAVLGLAKLAGAAVEDDPRSSKFGKIEIGPHQVDIWAGFQPVARYTAQFITGERKTQSGEIVVTDGTGPFGETRLDTATRFARSKLGPPAGLAVDALEGQDFVGESVDPASAIASRLIPLGWQQVYEAVEADRKDAMRGAIVGLLGLMGLGTVSIDDKTGDPIFQNPFNPRSPVEIEEAKLGVEVPRVEGYSLNADLQRQYAKYVEDSRHSALANLLSDPAYQSAVGTAKRELWETTSRKAADAGRKAFGLDLAVNGKNQEEIVAGTTIALTHTPSNYGRSEVLDILRQESVLTPEITQLIDAQRKQSDPQKRGYDLSVADYLHGKELVDAWRSSPAFIVGDPNVWVVAKRAREQYMELIRNKTADEIKRSASIQNFYATAAGGWLRTLYSTAGSRNTKYVHPTRIQIARDTLWDNFQPAIQDEP